MRDSRSLMDTIKELEVRAKEELAQEDTLTRGDTEIGYFNK